MSDDEKLGDKRRELIKRGEGCINHMYLDTVGKVTIGVGNMLPSVEAAQELPFFNRETGKTATPEEIQTDFENVSKQEPAWLASDYRQYKQLEMKEKAMLN
jgi:GH24 family phage-related lysozyme (muramidase)